jgi:hypothetical protein
MGSQEEGGSEGVDVCQEALFSPVKRGDGEMNDRNVNRNSHTDI